MMDHDDQYIPPVLSSLTLEERRRLARTRLALRLPLYDWQLAALGTDFITAQAEKDNER
jgi:hypothetical protein